MRLRAGPQLADAALEKIFGLFKANMKEMYRASSWGWHPAKKKAEFKESGMIHLILPPKVGQSQEPRERRKSKEPRQYVVASRVLQAAPIASFVPVTPAHNS